jgi:hypothetical protein
LTEPTYTITVIIERTDAPGAKFTAVLSEIPKASAERADYPHSGAVQTFRQYVLNEEEPAATPEKDPQV